MPSLADSQQAVYKFERSGADGPKRLDESQMRKDRPDEPERFIAGLMQRLRARLGRRCERLMSRLHIRAGRRGARRLVLEALRIRTLQAGADPEWWLITWNVERMSVKFQRFPTREALRAAVRAR